MNREIKIRLWHEAKKEMRVYEHLSSLPPNYTALEVMQYTGLKDKNGKEIFEGDIILYLDSDRTCEDVYTNKGVLKYDEWGFYITNRNEVDMCDIDPTECEIIGNIYETPELLK